MSDDIINWYSIPEVRRYLKPQHNPNKKYHNLSIPFMGVILGPTGSGKTQLVLSLIKCFSDKLKNKEKSGTFYSIDYITSNKDEPLLDYLATKSANIHIYEDLSELKIDEKDKNKNHLIIFDDMCVKKNQDIIMNAYVRARKRGCSCLYLTQDFYRCPPLIRKQSHYIFILRVNNMRELNFIMRTYCMMLTKEQMEYIYEYATSTPYSCLTIDTTTQDIYRKFRKGIIEFINPDDFICGV